MTFIFCTQAVEGGSWNRLIEALEHLTEHGHRCHLIAFSNPDMPRLRQLRGAEVHEIKADPNEQTTLRYTLGAYRALRKIQLPPPPEVVWAGSFAGNSGIALTLYKLTANRRFYMFSLRRGAQLRKLRIEFQRRGSSIWWRSVKTLIHKALTTVMMRSSELLITQTQKGLDQLGDEYSWSIPEFTEVIPNNLNTRWIRRKVEEVKRNTEKDAGECFQVCFVGRLQVREKGIDTFLEAAADLGEIDVSFSLVGDGPDKDKVQKLIEKFDLGNRVELYGWMENPLHVVAESDLMVVPSRADPLPNVVLEGLATETPVIGSDVDGIPVMLGHESLLFRPGDSDRLAELIRKASTSSGMFEKLKRLCEERASQFRFNWGQKFENIFQRTTESLRNVR